MYNETLTSWMHPLAQQINAEHALVQAALREARIHAITIGKRLLEAMGEVPPLTGPEWITDNTTLSLTEAYALIRLTHNATLLGEVDTRVAALNTRQYAEYRQAQEKDVVSQAVVFGQGARLDDAVLEAQIELCRAVLSRSDATPFELAAVERVLKDTQNRIATLLAGDVGSALNGAVRREDWRDPTID